MATNVNSSDGIVRKSGHVKDITGQRFSRLQVVCFKGYNERHTALWECRCDCGNIVIATSGHLSQGNTKSCGCLKEEKNPEHFRRYNYRHGKHGHPLYSTWKNMRSRCNNPNNNSYYDYGGRGIKVCKEWDSFATFLSWAIANGWGKGLTLDRIDNDKGYSPENCRIATWKDQVRNRRKTVFLTYKGETKPLSQWCEELGLRMKTCYGRLHYYHWTDPEEILFGKKGA